MSVKPLADTVIDSCDSTNDLARELGEAGCAHGTWISARSQTRGRGRLGREWQSMEGNLFLSIVVKPENRELWTWIPMATAIGVAEALRSLFPGFQAQVKWPNDLWVDGKKLGGILCEAVGSRGHSFVIIGIGLNCAGAPEGLDQLTTSVTAERGKTTTADDVRTAVIRHVLDWMKLDSARIRGAYESLAAFPPGTRIQWAEGAQSGAVIGLGPSGELQVKKSSGETVSLFAEDVKIRAAN